MKTCGDIVAHGNFSETNTQIVCIKNEEFSFFVSVCHLLFIQSDYLCVFFEAMTHQ